MKNSNLLPFSVLHPLQISSSLNFCFPAFPLLTLHFFLLFLTPFATASPPQPFSTPSHPVVIALKPDKDPDRMLPERRQLSDFLSAHLSRPVQVIVPLTSAVIFEGFTSGTIDLAYLSALDMLHARRASIASALLVGEIQGRTSYNSYWLVRNDSPYQSLEDLRGKPIAFASRTSTSGYLIPHADLIRRGLLPPHSDPELFFGRGNVWFGTGYASAVHQLLLANVEAAAVSDYVLDSPHHLPPSDRARLRKLTQQGPVPTHVLAVRASLPAPEVAALRAALLALNDSAPDLRDRVFTSPLVPADESAHLAPLEEALRLTQPLPE